MANPIDGPILLVDDEAGIRTVLGITLTDSGYAVTTAGNGEEALRLFREIRPAIVLTDIKMPDMDGIELLQHIKAEAPETEVIMFTGHGDMDLAIKSLKHDATDFVTKPINDEVLEIALKRARERIVMRRQLREYTHELERLVDEKARQLVEAERMAAVGQTVSELAHTIKNIANALKGSIFVLGKGIELDEREYLLEGWRMVKSNVEKIKDLSLDLLHYGKYGRISLQVCDPLLPVEEALRLVRERAAAYGVELAIEPGEGLVPVEMDPEALQCGIVNLIDNAIDACRIRPDASVVVRIRPCESGGVEYQVADSGGGMDEATRTRLFQSFFSTKGTEGTGIGLMMAKRIVDQHAGSIEVHSRPGMGTTVVVRLPGGRRPEGGISRSCS
jgi:signal transduction histidine kinase